MRKRTGIALDILKALDREPLIISHLECKANSDYPIVMSITEVLMDHGLVDRTKPQDSETKKRDKRVKYLYHITDCGRDVLKRGIRLCWTLGFDFNTNKKVSRITPHIVIGRRGITK